jgi:3-oxoacyl-[acyl-carrier protein] reductase
MSKKKVVVISGGSDGLGKAIATRLAPVCTLVLLSPNRTKLEKVAKSLNCNFEVCDVADHMSVKNAIEQVIFRYGRVDCLVNNAGLWIEGPLETNDPKEIHQVFGVNVLGVIHLTRTVIPVMKKQRGGVIININSERGLSGKSDRSVYTASKWAITGLTKSLQPELAPFGIAVTGIYPGKMNTGLFKKAGIKKDLTGALPVDEVAAVVESLINTVPKSVVFPEISIRGIDD